MLAVIKPSLGIRHLPCHACERQEDDNFERRGQRTDDQAIVCGGHCFRVIQTLGMVVMRIQSMRVVHASELACGDLRL